jgi:hypothetical protein
MVLRGFEPFVGSKIIRSTHIYLAMPMVYFESFSIMLLVVEKKAHSDFENWKL